MQTNASYNSPHEHHIDGSELPDVMLMQTNSAYNTLHEQQLDDTERLDEDAKALVNDEDSTIAENKKKKITKKQKKSTGSQTLTNLYAAVEDNDSITTTKKTSADVAKERLQKKIQTTFQHELRSHLHDVKQAKAAALLTEDSVRIKRKQHEETTQNQRANQQKQTQTTQLSQQQLLVNQQIHIPLKEYIALFGESLIKKSPEKEHRKQALRTSLQQQGVSTSQLATIETSAKAIIGNDLKRMLRERFTSLALSYNKHPTPALIKNHSQYKSLLNMAQSNDLFNSQPDAIGQLKNDVKQEIGDFISTELDRQVAKTKLQTTDIKALKTVFDSFNNLASISHFNANNYMESFKKKCDNEGLLPFIAPHATKGTLDSTQPSTKDLSKLPTDASSSQSDDHPSEKRNQDETELLNLYIQSNLSTSLLERFKNSRTIAKQQTRCIAQGICLATLKKQAHALSVMRARLTLRSLFEHRATLPELKGPQYDLFKQSLKKTCKQLKRLQNPVTKNELAQLKDHSNQAIFTIIKEEYIKNNVFLEAQPNNQTLIHQKKTFITILDRLRSETTIKESINPKLMHDLHFLDDASTIIEAA